MAWRYCRIAIFISAFLFGLLVFGSGGSSAESKIGTEQALPRAREATEVNCTDTNFILIQLRDRPVAVRAHLTGM